MCGRYSFFDTDRLYERFYVDRDNKIKLEDHYNITPGQTMPVITNVDQRRVELKRWGLIPHWAKNESIGYKMINARAETIADKPSFKKPLATQRCLVPASGYFEWQQTDTAKQPFFFHRKDKQPFAFAGIFDTWQNPKTSKKLSTYTIITTDALDRFSAIHPRMPVILKQQEEDDWLNPDLIEPMHITPLLNMPTIAQLTARPISALVNSPKNDTPTIIK